MRLCLFEDAGSAGLDPLSLARPVFDLRCGAATLADKHLRHFRARTAAAVVRPHLAGLVAEARPDWPVNDLGWLRAGPVVLVNGRWLPPAKPAGDPLARGPGVYVAGDELAYAVPDAAALGGAGPFDLETVVADCLERLPRHPAGGRLVRDPWDLIAWNADELAADFRPGGESHGRPGTLSLVGPSDWLRVHETARIDPFVVADTTAGPVVIDRDAVVASFTRLDGPCYVGPRAVVSAAQVRGSSVGPDARVGGVVENSILDAGAEKPHDGHLGHSYLGARAVLGAGTQTADRRADRGSVRLRSGERVEAAGAAIGDYAATGVGVLLNAGTAVGPFATVLPWGGLVPREVPAFGRVDQGRLMDVTDAEPALRAAARALARRGDEFTAAHRAAYRYVFERTAARRRQAMHEAELRRLRRSA